MTKLPLSVVMIARNEENYIERAVKSCSFADDIVVVDGGSSDRTVELARAAGARVVSRAWTNFSDQRNFSLDQARHEWVLVVDADEAATPALEEWLREFFRAGRDQGKPYGFKIKRAEFFLGRRIYGACWNPSYQDRFFRRSKGRYEGEIHEWPRVEGGMELAPETALLDHSPNMTMESFLEKMNRYTTIEAFDRYQAGKRTSIPHIGVAFFATWWKNYFYYKGYRDGAHGFVICVMEGVSRTVRHLKLWQIQKMHEQGRGHLLPNPRRAMEGSAARAMEARSERKA